jgi:uncharacterized protein
MFFTNLNQDKVIVGKLSYDSDLLDELTAFCKNNSIKAGWINLIGAVSCYNTGYYEQNLKEYKEIKSPENETGFEIASCSGNISIKDSKPFVHLHAVFTDKNGKAFGGHVLKGTKIFAAEFMIFTFEGEDLTRFHDEETGLFLWK